MTEGRIDMATRIIKLKIHYFYQLCVHFALTSLMIKSFLITLTGFCSALWFHFLFPNPFSKVNEMENHQNSGFYTAMVQHYQPPWCYWKAEIQEIRHENGKFRQKMSEIIINWNILMTFISASSWIERLVNVIKFQSHKLIADCHTLCELKPYIAKWD